MKVQCVDPAVISVWRWQACAASLVLICGSGVASFIEGRYLWPMLPVLAAAVSLPLSWFWPATMYRHLRFGVDEAGIVIREGVYFHSHIALPRVRIQHTDVAQGPLQRRFGVGTLKFYTAGSRYTKIELPGLAHAEAVRLRDALLAQENDSGV